MSNITAAPNGTSGPLSSRILARPTSPAGRSTHRARGYPEDHRSRSRPFPLHRIGRVHEARLDTDSARSWPAHQRAAGRTGPGANNRPWVLDRMRPTLASGLEARADRAAAPERAGWLMPRSTTVIRQQPRARADVPRCAARRPAWTRAGITSGPRKGPAARAASTGAKWSPAKASRSTDQRTSTTACATEPSSVAKGVVEGYEPSTVPSPIARHGPQRSAAGSERTWSLIAAGPRDAGCVRE